MSNGRSSQTIEESNVRWKKAGKTVSAKDYWENFFVNNPTQKPKHIVYYDGRPTTAIYDFQESNDIGKADTSKTDGKLLGFDDHFVTDMKDDPRANNGYSELMATGRKIISEHYNR